MSGQKIIGSFPQIDTTRMGPLPTAIKDIAPFLAQNFPGDASWASDQRFAKALAACFEIYETLPRRRNRPEESVFWHKARTAHQVWNCGLFCNEETKRLGAFVALAHDIWEDTRDAQRKGRHPLVNSDAIASWWPQEKDRPLIHQALAQLTDQEGLSHNARKLQQETMVAALNPRNWCDKIVGVVKYADKHDNLIADLIDMKNKICLVPATTSPRDAKEIVAKKVSKLLHDNTVVMSNAIIPQKLKNSYGRNSLALRTALTTMETAFRKAHKEATIRIQDSTAPQQQSAPQAPSACFV